MDPRRGEIDLVDPKFWKGAAIALPAVIGVYALMIWGFLTLVYTSS